MNLSDLDAKFSLAIRERANHICERCNSAKATENSHYFTRHVMSTRFEPDNCAALCWKCHCFFHNYPPAHNAWMQVRLGKERFEALRIKHNQFMKLDREEIMRTIKAMERKA